jgi:hypothetical protein
MEPTALGTRQRDSFVNTVEHPMRNPIPRLSETVDKAWYVFQYVRNTRWRNVLLATVFCVLTPIVSRADPAMTFAQAANSGGSGVLFGGINPSQLGNPDTPPTSLAQVVDTGGALGSIVGNMYWSFIADGVFFVGEHSSGTFQSAMVGSATSTLDTAASSIVSNGSTDLSSLQAIGSAVGVQLAIFDQIQYTGPAPGGGTQTVNLASVLETAILGSSGLTTYTLPAGGSIIVPSSTLFSGSGLYLQSGAQVSGGQVEVAVLRTSGGQDYLAVFFDDSGTALLSSDTFKINLGNVISPSQLGQGIPVASTSMVAYVAPATGGTTDGPLPLWSIVAMAIGLLAVTWWRGAAASGPRPGAMA